VFLLNNQSKSKSPSGLLSHSAAISRRASMPVLADLNSPETKDRSNSTLRMKKKESKRSLKHLEMRDRSASPTPEPEKSPPARSRSFKNLPKKMTLPRSTTKPQL